MQLDIIAQVRKKERSYRGFNVAPWAESARTNPQFWGFMQSFSDPKLGHIPDAYVVPKELAVDFPELVGKTVGEIRVAVAEMKNPRRTNKPPSPGCPPTGSIPDAQAKADRIVAYIDSFEAPFIPVRIGREQARAYDVPKIGKLILGIEKVTTFPEQEDREARSRQVGRRQSGTDCSTDGFATSGPDAVSERV